MTLRNKKSLPLKAIRASLPARAVVALKKTAQGSRFIEIKVYPSLSESAFAKAIKKQKDLLKGRVNELFTEERGSHWYIYLSSKH